MSASISYDENHRLIISGLECDCACEHRIPDQDIYVGEDIVEKLPEYIGKRKLGSNCVLVCDKNRTHSLLQGKGLRRSSRQQGST